MVELKAHCSECQSFEYPCLHKVVKVKDRPRWFSLCWHLSWQINIYHCKHNKVQQVVKQPEQGLSMTEKSRNVESHNIVYQKFLTNFLNKTKHI